MRGRPSTKQGPWLEEKIAIPKWLKHQPCPLSVAILADSRERRNSLGLAHSSISEAEADEFVAVLLTPEIFEPSKAEEITQRLQQQQARVKAAIVEGGKRSGDKRRATGKIANALRNATDVMERLKGGKINAQQALNSLRLKIPNTDLLPSVRALHEWKQKVWK